MCKPVAPFDLSHGSQTLDDLDLLMYGPMINAAEFVVRLFFFVSFSTDSGAIFSSTSAYRGWQFGDKESRGLITAWGAENREAKLAWIQTFIDKDGITLP